MSDEHEQNMRRSFADRGALIAYVQAQFPNAAVEQVGQPEDAYNLQKYGADVAGYNTRPFEGSYPKLKNDLFPHK